MSTIDFLLRSDTWVTPVTNVFMTWGLPPPTRTRSVRESFLLLIFKPCIGAMIGWPRKSLIMTYQLTVSWFWKFYWIYIQFHSHFTSNEVMILETLVDVRPRSLPGSWWPAYCSRACVCVCVTAELLMCHHSAKYIPAAEYVMKHFSCMWWNYHNLLICEQLLDRQNLNINQDV